MLPKLQRMSNGRQLWLCNSGQSLPVLIACHFKRNHYLVLPDAGATEAACEQNSTMGFLWLFVHLPSYSFGSKRGRALNTPSHTLDGHFAPDRSPSPTVRGERGFPRVGRLGSWVQLRSGTMMRKSWHLETHLLNTEASGKTMVTDSKVHSQPCLGPPMQGVDSASQV